MALYRGWSLEGVREGSDDNAVSSISTPFPSSFTPINAPAPSTDQQPTPPLTKPPTCQTYASQRERDPVVAAYLGRLGPEIEGSSFDRYLPPPSAREPERKRKRDTNQTSARKTRKSSKKSPKQKSVSDGLRVSKPNARRALTPKETQDYYLEKPNRVKGASKTKAPQLDVQGCQQQCYTSDAINQSSSTTLREQQALTPLSGTLCREKLANNDKVGIDTISEQATVTVPGKGLRSKTSVETCPAVSKDNGDDALASFCLEILPASPTIDGSDATLDALSDIDDIFDAVDLDDCCRKAESSNAELQLTDAQKCEEQRPTSNIQGHAPDFFDDGVDDDDFLDLDMEGDDYGESTITNRTEQATSEGLLEVLPCTPAQRSSLASHQYQSTCVASAYDRGITRQFMSPMTPSSQSHVQLVDTKPIVRPPFPSQARDRSPVIGLSPNCLLRTCFRVGEAINAGCGAVKNGKNVVLELYARILSTERTETKQHFVFCDLFHSKPPYIHAEYDATIWKSVDRHEYDARRFLQGDGYKMCRCIGKMKRNGNEWMLTILNIWEAKMDDILWVEGIVNA